jgi:hypothetical protein
MNSKSSRGAQDRFGADLYRQVGWHPAIFCRLKCHLKMGTIRPRGYTPPLNNFLHNI